MYKLIIEDDEGKTTVVPLIRDEISIGRKEGNTIRLTERNVSRRHARLMRQNGAVYIEDLTSYNGIKVNGDRINGKAAVGEGDRIQIGDYQLSVKLDREAQNHQGNQNQKSIPPGAGAPRGEDGATTPFNKTTEATAIQPAPTVTVPAPAVTTQISVPTVQNQVPQAVSSPTVAAAPDKPARLVVVSKNFAGQEFPVDKAAVVIGRTDENDVVINHRSISRHHAKVVREGGHYHIVDLQSANGVRVNGEEYGKVELRKGDKIDLGHVRLVFVPPGQEFDVRGKVEETEPASKRSGLVLLLVALLILGGAGVITRYLGMWPGGQGTPGKLDPDGEAAKQLLDVDSDLHARRWAEAIDKAEHVLKMTDISQAPKDAANTKKDKAEAEKKTQGVYEQFRLAGGASKYEEALNLYREIPADSVYHGLAQDDYDKMFSIFAKNHLKQAEDYRTAGKCTEFKSEVQLVLNLSPTHVEAGSMGARPCPAEGGGTRVAEPTPPRTPGRQHTGKHPAGQTASVKEPDEQPHETAPSPEAPASNEEENEKKLHDAQEAYVNGDYGKALEIAQRLRTGTAASRAWRIIGGAACQTKDLKLAGDAYKHLDATNRQFVTYVCHRSGLALVGGQFRVQE